MKGIRFYQEFETPRDKRKGISTGNCVAVLVANGIAPNGQWGIIAGVYDRPNSPVVGSTCTPEFLRKKCKRIPEHKARQIHPILFFYLENAL